MDADKTLESKQETVAEQKLEQPVAEKKVEAPATEKVALEKEEYKDFGEYESKIERVPVEKKNVPTSSYGHRIRVAKLFDSHEEFLYKIITVSGWAKTVRQGNKDFTFVELTDGSSMKGIQVVIFKEIAGFEEITKCNVGTSFQFKGTLIKSPAKG